jgi:hypothetical protein
MAKKCSFPHSHFAKAAFSPKQQLILKLSALFQK